MVGVGIPLWGLCHGQASGDCLVTPPPPVCEVFVVQGGREEDRSDPECLCSGSWDAEILMCNTGHSRMQRPRAVL